MFKCDGGGNRVVFVGIGGKGIEFCAENACVGRVSCKKCAVFVIERVYVGRGIAVYIGDLVVRSDI